MILADLAGSRVAVWGTGREGVAAVRALAGVPNVDVIAVDENADRDAAAWREQAGDTPLVLGEKARAALASADVVLKSPGISRFHPWVDELMGSGVEVTSGTRLWVAEHAGATVAVTGSKGKSTTSSLIHHLLSGLGERVSLGGNIGVPLLDLPKADRYVVELSSYQCSDLRDGVHVAVVTALFPEHVDWHGSTEQYFRDKLNLLAQGPDHVVINGTDPLLVARVGDLRLAAPPLLAAVRSGPWVGDEEFWWGETALFPRSVLPLMGAHNAGNLCVALGAVAACGVDVLARRDEVARVLAGFEPLPHRLTPISDPSGLTFVDDTLATNPQATVLALEAYAGRAVTLIVGGADRGLDYGVLRESLSATTGPVVVIGIPDSGPRILSALTGLPHVHCHNVEDLDAAVRLARQVTPVGGAVLLSPGAPSYGRFANYEHRSAAFLAAIKASR